MLSNYSWILLAKVCEYKASPHFVKKIYLALKKGMKDTLAQHWDFLLEYSEGLRKNGTQIRF